MPRAVRCALIQARNQLGPDAALPEIKQAMVDRHVTLIADAARQGARAVCLQELFYQEDERLLLRAMFARAGADVRIAGSAAEALSLLDGWPADVVVSDLAMPDRDGYTLIRELRRVPRWQRIPAVAVTAHARPEDRQAALAAGFTRYISKPLDPDTLLAVVEGIVRRAERDLR